MNKSNYSSAEDQAILVSECMKYDPFRKVVNTREYSTQALSGYSFASRPTQYFWENTNKLLGNMEGLIGCKTGITNAAGPCFGGYYENKEMDLTTASEVKYNNYECYSKQIC